MTDAPVHTTALMSVSLPVTIEPAAYQKAVEAAAPFEADPVQPSPVLALNEPQPVHASPAEYQPVAGFFAPIETPAMAAVAAPVVVSDEIVPEPSGPSQDTAIQNIALNEPSSSDETSPAVMLAAVQAGGGEVLAVADAVVADNLAAPVEAANPAPVVMAEAEPVADAPAQLANVHPQLADPRQEAPPTAASPPDMELAQAAMGESDAWTPPASTPLSAAAPARFIPASVAVAHEDRDETLSAPIVVPKSAGKVPEQSTAAKLVPVTPVPRIDVPTPQFGHDEARLYPAAMQVSASPQNVPPADTQLGRVGTLEQALRYSYANNPRILAARASVRSADFSYPAARSTVGPRLDAFATLSYTRDRDEVLPGTYQRSQGWTDTAGLILSQPLLTFGRTAAATGQALASIEYQRQSLRLAEDQVMLDTVSSYVGVLRDSGAVTIARENVVLLQKELDDARVRFKVRDITLADVNQVEARLALAQTILLDAKARLAAQQSRFYSVIGIAPGELAPPSPLEVGVSTITDAYAVGDANSPLIMAAQAREKMSRALLEAAKAERMPMVGLRGTADYGSVSDYSNDLRATRLRGQVTVSVPLFGGGRSAEIGRAEEANVADWRLMEAASRDTRSEIATGWNNLIAARRNVDHFRDAVQASQAAYEGAKQQERAGMRTTLELLDLTRDLLDVRNKYNEALANEFLARAALLSAMGVLEADKLVPELELYDPATHFAKVRARGDIPLLTGALASLDGVVVGNLEADRPNQDPASLAGIGQFEDDP